MTVSAFGVDHGDISKGILGALKVPGQIKTGLQAVKLNTKVAGNLAGKAIGNSNSFKAVKAHPTTAGVIGSAGALGAAGGYSQHKHNQFARNINTLAKSPATPKFGA